MHTLRRWLRGSNIEGQQQAELRLTRAYRTVFLKDEDAQIVLADLAKESGYYQVAGPGVSGDNRAFADGRRDVFARILGRLRMTDAEIARLEEAAREEALMAQRETG